MTICNLQNKNMADLERRGMIGTPTFLPYWLSWSKLGDTNDQSGRYYVRQGKNGKITIKSRHYWPRPNPNARQIYLNGIFRNGVAEWHSLTLEQKKYYNELRYPVNQRGFTRFMTKYLKTHI